MVTPATQEQGQEEDDAEKQQQIKILLVWLMTESIPSTTARKMSAILTIQNMAPIMAVFAEFAEQAPRLSTDHVKERTP